MDVLYIRSFLLWTDAPLDFSEYVNFNKKVTLNMYGWDYEITIGIECPNKFTKTPSVD